MARRGPPAYPLGGVSPTAGCWLADETRVWLGKPAEPSFAALRLGLCLDPVAVSARALEQGWHQGIRPSRRTRVGHTFDVIEQLVEPRATWVAELTVIVVSMTYRPAYRCRYVAARSAR
jgi:hypothetical protein